MRNKKILWRLFQVGFSVCVTVGLIGTLWFVTQGRDMPVLEPEGTIANQQLILIAITVGLGFLVVIPVFILLFAIAWRYRDGNKKAKYEPELDGNAKLEVLWWGIPVIIIIALAVITYITSHSLDPFKDIEADKPAITVQGISLNRNWLFIYPEERIATLNYMNIPEDTPINMKLTSDAPMNTFWVPALAGQVYTMSGMTMELSLMADNEGEYRGMTSNISGEGYADLTFVVNSLNDADFAMWKEQSINSSYTLDWTSYPDVSGLEERTDETTYALTDKQLYDRVVNKYMEHMGSHGGSH